MPFKNKFKMKIGFVPAHRGVFDENWAVEMRKRCLEVLSENKNIDLIVPDENMTEKGLVRDEIEAERVIRLFNEKEVAGIVIGTMTFGDEISTLKVAESFSDLPILLFGTKEGPFTSNGNRRSDSFCGTLSVSSGLYRRGIPFLFAGIVFPEEESFRTSIADFVRVCAIVDNFIGARIGQVGPRPESFETCIFNESSMMEQFGQRVIPVSLSEIFDAANSLKDDDSCVQEIIGDIKKHTNPSEVKEESLVKIAKLEVSLKRFSEEKKIHAMGVQCWTAIQKVYGVCSCIPMGRLTDQGIMASCEVDIYGALTMLVQYSASLGSTPPHFIDWTIKRQDKKNQFLAWHCGNAPMSLVCKGCPIELREQSVLVRSLGPEISQGTAEFQLRPGPVTICRLVEYDGEFKMLIAKGEIKEDQQKLRGSWSWVEVPDLDLLYRILVEEGFIHHASMIHGDYSKAIADACYMLDIETIVV